MLPVSQTNGGSHPTPLQERYKLNAKVESPPSAMKNTSPSAAPAAVLCLDQPAATPGTTAETAVARTITAHNAASLRYR